MAFGLNTVWEVESGGDDTNNGGGFNPSNANFATDLTATSGNTGSPVVSSASYNFVSGDIGAFVFIQSGTNWIPGWYKIVSVAGNAATLTASIGSVSLYSIISGNLVWGGMNLTVGCATTASPTGGVWSVDYSQQTAAQISYTDMVIGATTTQYTSVGNPVGKNIIGNIISVTSGTGFTVQRVEVVSTSTITATCDKTLGTTASTGGHGGLGGALASPGKASGLMVSANRVAVKQATYTFSATQNVSAGSVSLASGSQGAASEIFSYATNRFPYNTDTRSVIECGANSTTCFTTGQYGVVTNFICQNTGTKTSCVAFNHSTIRSVIWNCKSQDIATAFTLGGGACSTILCEAVNAPTQSFNLSGSQNIVIACVARGGSKGFKVDSSNTNYLAYCYSLSPVSGSNCFDIGNGSNHLMGCVGYKTTGGGTNCFNCGDLTNVIINCIAHSAVAYGFANSTTPVNADAKLINCAGYNNGTADYQSNFSLGETAHNFIHCSADPFTSVSTLDFSLNNVVGGGASLRAAAFTSIYPGLLGTNNLDIGGFQSAGATPGVTNIAY